MSEQLDIFGGNSVVQVGPSKVAKAEKVQSKTTNKPRYGVCECGRKGWPLYEPDEEKAISILEYDLEIIGDIYQNPELLEEQSDED
ncbi:hypothetical protein [Aneurinibacillus aneurinilyticus]|uniref:hypothetical protein n=1 Tax=Aneurinibacillus aneurinilyticus TaxID=1391 RepID=UPI0023F474CD|nr:hypothetical protein [Aneurinibacillus aneurinilyticus]